MEDSIRNIIESLELCFKDADVHNFDLESEVCLNMTFKELQFLLYELHKEYLEGLIKYIQSVMDDKFEWEIKHSREEYFKI